MNAALIVAGIIVLLMGLVFVGQGSGIFPYPASSFMVGSFSWVYYGGAIAVVGLVLIIVGWR